MESTPPESPDRANIHDLAMALKEQTSGTDALTSFLDRIEGTVTGLSKELSNMAVREHTKAELAKRRHDELCAKLDAQTKSLGQYGELLHAGLKRISDLEDEVYDDGGRHPAHQAE